MYIEEYCEENGWLIGIYIVPERNRIIYSYAIPTNRAKKGSINTRENNVILGNFAKEDIKKRINDIQKEGKLKLKIYVQGKNNRLHIAFYKEKI